MLRLRPSELTLTPDDVDETFRRLAQRQTSRAPAFATSRTSAHPGRPHLRRGPQRSTGDAITALGTIPILRPQPQQAIHTSVDADIEDGPDPPASPSRDIVQRAAGTSPPLQDGRTLSVRTSAALAIRGIQLPFRLRRTRRNSSAQSTPDEQAAEATSMPPAGSSGHAVVGLAGTFTANNAIEESSQSRSVASADSHAELRGGGRPSTDRAHTIARDTSHAPSPLQTLSSLPRQETLQVPEDAQESLNEDPPPIYLQGYFEGSKESPGYQYTFQECDPPLPHTEPRRYSGRHSTLLRSLSSGSAPAFALPTHRLYRSGSLAEDVFNTVQAPQPSMRPLRGSSNIYNRQNYSSSSSSMIRPSNHLTQIYQAQRLRQLSSEISNASATFSWYGSELRGSRDSNSEQSGQDQFAQTQYDGAVASSPNYPGRLLEVGVPNAASLRPPSSRASSQSSPNLATSAQHGVSPLPSMPYTRTRSIQSPLQPSTGFVNRLNTSGGPVDAATAAAHDLRSPLDDYSEQYQRLVRNQHARQTMPVQPSTFQYEVDNVNTFRPRQGMGSGYLNLYNPYAQETVGHRQLQHHGLHSNHRSSDRLRNPPTYASQSYGRSSQATRASQRSSENAPVNSLPNEGRTARNGHVQTQFAAYELLHNAAQAMQAVNMRRTEGPPHGPSHFSMPQTTTPRGVSNRPHAQAPHQFTSRIQPRRVNAEMSGSPPDLLAPGQIHPGEAPMQADASGVSPEAPLRILPRRASRQHSGEGANRPHTRSYRQGPTAASPPLHLRPTLDTSLALDHGSDTTSRRSRSPVARATNPARTHRCVPRRQRDQENSWDGEMRLLRREETAINSRYGQDEQRNVMDDTPPRVGPVERRIFE